MKAETIKRVGEILEEAIENGVTMGASVGVWQHGEELLYVERGLADRENEKKIKRDTIFRLYSMSKPITAVAAMILMERGLLDFAQPVSDFLPGFAEVMVEKDGGVQKSETPVTVLNLLNMTSGLTYGDEKTTAGKMTLGYIEECIRRLHTPQAVTTAEFAEHLSMIPLDFVPDTSWRYGLSADVLGAVIEKASGMRFGEFMEKNIFADALIFDDYSALSLKRLDEYKNKLTVIAEKADKLALKLDKMRNDSIQRREGLSKEYSDMLDDFLHDSMFTDQICGIDKIENKVNVVEEEYVSLIAYIDFMTQIKTDLC